MATKKRQGDEGGSGAETKGRIAEGPDETDAEGPYGDTDIERDVEELEREMVAGGETSRRREQIASNPDNEEELAEEALEGSSEEEEEAGHDRGRRG